jgi:hypothetical protein
MPGNALAAIAVKSGIFTGLFLVTVIRLGLSEDINSMVNKLLKSKK